MPHRTASSLARKWWLDYTLFCFSGKFCPVPEDYIRNTIRNLGDCETATRYYDFFALISSIMRVGPWDECRVEQFLESFTKMEDKYGKCAMDEPDWLDLKLDTLFQMYLCLLREAVGVENDNLPEALSAEFHFSDSLLNEACRSKIDALMEKYKSYYVKKYEKTDILDVRYEQQRTALMESLTDKSKLFQLLQAHRVDVFKQNFVYFVQSVEEKVLPIPEGCTCTSPATGTGVRDYLPQQLQSQLPISTPPKYKRRFDGVDVNEEGGTAENGRGGSELHEAKKTLIEISVDSGNTSKTSPSARITTSRDMLRLQRRADIASGLKYWGPTGVAAIAANRQRYAEECAERKVNPPVTKPRSTDFSSTFRLSDMKIEARKQTKKFREQVLAADSGGHDPGTTMSRSSHNSSSNCNKGALSTLDSHIPTNPYARHTAVKMHPGSAGCESPDATSSASAAPATSTSAASGSATAAVEAAASRLAHDPTMLFQRKTEFSLMYHHRENLLAGAAAVVSNTGTTTGDTGNVFHHLRSDIYGIPYRKTTCTVNGKELELILTDDDLELVTYKKWDY